MKRFYKDERGSSLVLTIIAMTFISLLAVAVISMTVTNIRLKIAQKGSQKNFYNTDSIMDEVRAGVEDLAAQAAVEAYKSAFTSFNASLTGTSVDLEDIYKKKFLEEMIKSISGDQSHYGDATLYYKDEVLKNYLILNTDTNAAERYLPHKGTGDYPSGQLISGKSYGYMNLENDTLLLKDVRVTMTEGGSKKYKTTVTSDIRVTVPPMTADTYSEYLNYALIADNQIITDASANVEGSMYAGTVRRHESGASNPETGILVKGGFTLNANSENIVTRGDLVVDGGSKFLLDGYKGSAANLWAENIFTSGNAKNIMTLNNAVCNVSDDMEVGGKDDEVTITGEYIGYNYNASYAGTDLTQVTDKSQYSSAILINGMGANLDLSGLKKLILSGKTFISRKTESTEVDLRSGIAKAIDNKDIAMGEALSVKGSQVAYYVPSDFVTSAQVTTTWDSSLDHNDTVNREYVFRDPSDLTVEYTFNYGKYLKYLYGLDPNTATDAELDAKMGTAFNLWDYLDAGQPLMSYYRHNTAVDANAVEYFYLNFKSDVERIKFYPQFQNIIPRYSAVKDINANMGNTGILVNDNMDVYYASGNILRKDPSSTGDVSIKFGNESKVADSKALQHFATSESQAYMSMQLALVEAYKPAQDAIKNGQYRLLEAANTDLSKDGKNDNTNLYNVLIDTAKMATMTGLYAQPNGSNTGVVIIEPRQNETYVWNQAAQTGLGGLNKGIIIAAGDVKIQKDFSGLIIAGGDISLAADGVKVSSNNVLLEDMFTEDKALGNSSQFYHLFSKYFQKVVNSAIGQEDDATQDVVFYERWKKE